MRLCSAFFQAGRVNPDAPVLRILQAGRSPDAEEEEEEDTAEQVVICGKYVPPRGYPAGTR
jgi:hypothetical protein